MISVRNYQSLFIWIVIFVELQDIVSYKIQSQGKKNQHNVVGVQDKKNQNNPVQHQSNKNAFQRDFSPLNFQSTSTAWPLQSVNVTADNDDDINDDSGSGNESGSGESGNIFDSDSDNYFSGDDMFDYSTGSLNVNGQSKQTVVSKNRTTPYVPSFKKQPGAWTLNCPSPCSQSCAPACTPKCCMDNFAMAPPVPENMKDMYLCPDFCTGQSCASSCPSYCCALPSSSSDYDDGNSIKALTCPTLCKGYSTDNCPTNCDPVCCSSTLPVNSIQPEVVTPSYINPSTSMEQPSQQYDPTICSTFCSDPFACMNNSFCQQNCCKTTQ